MQCKVLLQQLFLYLHHVSSKTSCYLTTFNKKKFKIFKKIHQSIISVSKNCSPVKYDGSFACISSDRISLGFIRAEQTESLKSDSVEEASLIRQSFISVTNIKLSFLAFTWVPHFSIRIWALRRPHTFSQRPVWDSLSRLSCSPLNLTRDTLLQECPQRRHRRTVFSSTEKHSVQGHLFLTFIQFFHHKEHRKLLQI